MNGTKLILDDHGNNLDSFRLSQFGILQLLQRSHTTETSNWLGTIFCRFLQQTGSNIQIRLKSDTKSHRIRSGGLNLPGKLKFLFSDL